MGRSYAPGRKSQLEEHRAPSHEKPVSILCFPKFPYDIQNFLYSMILMIMTKHINTECCRDIDGYAIIKYIKHANNLFVIPFASLELIPLSMGPTELPQSPTPDQDHSPGWGSRPRSQVR